MLALCDADYKFLYVNIGCNGRVSDGGVFGRSASRSMLNDAEVHLPPNEKIGDNRLLPYTIVVDDAFPLEEHIMKPYHYNSKEKEKKNSIIDSVMLGRRLSMHLESFATDSVFYKLPFL